MTTIAELKEEIDKIKLQIKPMNADELSEAILKAILHTDIDFEQVYVGDEEEGEVYFKFCKVRKTNDKKT